MVLISILYLLLFDLMFQVWSHALKKKQKKYKLINITNAYPLQLLLQTVFKVSNPLHKQEVPLSGTQSPYLLLQKLKKVKTP